MEDSGEELAFVVEDAKESIIVPAIEAVLKDQDFDQVKVDQWTDTICESTMKGLVDLQKPFKYIGQLLFVFVCLVYPLLCARILTSSVIVILCPSTAVTCLIMQKNGAGVYSANSCFFDGVNDEVATVKWPGEKQKDANKTLNAIVTVTAMML